MCRSSVRSVARSNSRTEVPVTFQPSSFFPARRRLEEPLPLCVVPHEAEHWTVLSGHLAGPHAVVRPIFAPPSFTHLGGAESTRELSLTDGQAANARVLAARAQNSSAGTAGRLPVQWHVEIQAVRAAVGPLVSPRCTRGAKRCLRSTWRAPRGASEAGTGGPPTRPIEADVRPTRPGRGDAWGARGGP